MNIVSLDDHPIFSHGLREALIARNINFHVHTLEKAADALSYLKTHPNVDVVILDLDMPDMDGITFMHAMECRDIYVPVLVMTAKTELALLKQCLASGAMGILPKTAPIKEIEAALTRVHSGEMVISDSISKSLECVSKTAEENTETVLSKRQLEILKMVQSGLGNKDIASVLFISERTVKSHLQTVFRIFNAKNRIECVRKAEHLGILKEAAALLRYNL